MIFFSLLAKLKSLEYNKNFNSMLEDMYEFKSVQDIRTEFYKIKDIFSKLEKAEFEYILKNERFKAIFGDELIQMLG